MEILFFAQFELFWAIIATKLDYFDSDKRIWNNTSQIFGTVIFSGLPKALTKSIWTIVLDCTMKHLVLVGSEL